MLGTLKYHLRTRAALELLRASLGTTEEQRDRRYERLILAIQERFREAGGLPPEAAPDAPAPSPVYWLAYGDDLLLQFIVEETPLAPRGPWDLIRRYSRWRQGVTRDVTIIGVVPMLSRSEAPPPDSSTAPG
jgi:hypothetical protein